MDIVDDNSSRLKYQGDWSIDHITGAINGTVHTSSDPTGYVSLSFTGTYIELDALRSPTGANFTILLDGSSYGPYPLYSTDTSVTNVWSTTGLNPTATHTIEVHKSAATGIAGAVDINVDAFQVSSQPPSSNTSGLIATSTSHSASTSTSKGTSASPTLDPNVANGASTSSSSSSASSSSTSSHSSTKTSSSTSHTPTTTSTHRTSSTSTSTSSSTPLAVAGATTSTTDRTGIIMGSIVAVVIGLCLITIPVVWFRRRRAKANSAYLRSSTTPAYQTTSVSMGLIPPVGLYNRHSGNNNSNYGIGASPTMANTVSSHSQYPGPTDSQDGRPVSVIEEGPSRYLLYPHAPPPTAPPPPDPAYLHPRRYTESISSDYPYPTQYDHGATSPSSQNH